MALRCTGPDQALSCCFEGGALRCLADSESPKSPLEKSKKKFL
jgi:hypothetical protein